MISIRTATVKDAPLLTTMIRELAEYEHLDHELGVTQEAIARDGFGPRPKFRALIAESDREIAGYALFFEFYSSFQGRAVLWLDDLFVRPPFRKLGVGKALLAHVAAVAVREEYFCIRWEVLDWNELAIGFYNKHDAAFLDEWREGCLIGDPLQAMADQAK